MRAAAINAASVVGHVDTQTGLLSQEAIGSELDAMRDKLPVRTWSH